MKKEVSSKKAQAAMEFLMTYGWVLVVVMIVIVALTWIVHAQKFKQEVCIIEAGFYCKEFRVYNNGLQVIIENGKGYDIQNVRLSVTGQNIVCYQINAVTSILNGQSANFYITCPSGINTKENFRADIKMSYEKLTVNPIQRNTEVTLSGVSITGQIPAATGYVYSSPICADIYLDNLDNKAGSTCGLGWVLIVMSPGQDHRIIAVNGSLQGSITANLPQGATGVSIGSITMS